MLWAFSTALTKHIPNLTSRVGILLTSDEEGHGTHGIKQVIPILQRGFKADWALVGSQHQFSMLECLQTLKKRSYTIEVELQGQQGHSAYPQHAWEPKALSKLLSQITDFKLKLPHDYDLSLVSISSSTQTSNIIPASIKLTVNMRYMHSNIVESFIRLCKNITVLCVDTLALSPTSHNPNA